MLAEPSCGLARPSFPFERTIPWPPLSWMELATIRSPTAFVTLTPGRVGPPLKATMLPGPIWFPSLPAETSIPTPRFPRFVAVCVSSVPMKLPARMVACRLVGDQDARSVPIRACDDDVAEVVVDVRELARADVAPDDGAGGRVDAQTSAATARATRCVESDRVPLDRVTRVRGVEVDPERDEVPDPIADPVGPGAPNLIRRRVGPVHVDTRVDRGDVVSADAIACRDDLDADSTGEVVDREIVYLRAVGTIPEQECRGAFGHARAVDGNLTRRLARAEDRDLADDRRQRRAEIDLRRPGEGKLDRVVGRIGVRSLDRLAQRALRLCAARVERRRGVCVRVDRERRTGLRSTSASTRGSDRHRHRVAAVETAALARDHEVVGVGGVEADVAKVPFDVKVGVPLDGVVEKPPDGTRGCAVRSTPGGAAASGSSVTIVAIGTELPWATV